MIQRRTPLKRSTKPLKRTALKRTQKPLKRASIKIKTVSEDVLWKWFSIYIRLRDAEPITGIAKCFTCRRRKHWRQGDCGHGIPRQHKATKYYEINNHFQCKRCNGFEGGKREVYKEQVDKIYGQGTWNRIEVMSRQVCKRGKFEIELMADHYKREAEKLSKQKQLPIKP